MSFTLVQLGVALKYYKNERDTSKTKSAVMSRLKKLYKELAGHEYTNKIKMQDMANISNSNEDITEQVLKAIYPVSNLHLQSIEARRTQFITDYAFDHGNKTNPLRGKTTREALTKLSESLSPKRLLQQVQARRQKKNSAKLNKRANTKTPLLAAQRKTPKPRKQKQSDNSCLLCCCCCIAATAGVVAVAAVTANKNKR